MATVPLPLVEKNCGLELEEAIPDLVARRLDLRGCLAACLDYRRMGIAKLLMSGLPDEFFADLARSARAFLYFLEGCDDGAKVTSRAEPFFDAIACRDVDGAMRIARASRPAWQEGREYEDDFLYVWFLMQRFAVRAVAAELEAILARWELVLEGNRDVRLDLCRALLRGDQEAFDEALETLIAGRQRELAELLEAERCLPEDVPTTAKVWVELLALLRLAEEAGLRTPLELPLAPSVARRVDRARLPAADDWRGVPSYRELS